MPEQQLFDLYTAMPTLWPAAYGLLLLVFVPLFKDDRQWLWAFSLAGMALMTVITSIMLLQIGDYGDVRLTAGGFGMEMVRTDRLALWLDLLFAICGFLALLVLPSYLARARAYRGEIFPLTFIAVAGMTIMVGTDNLLMIFLGLEVLSIALYVMTGIARERAVAVEAALKYFLLGAFSTGFLVYGIALIFGATGSLNLTDIAVAVSGLDADGPAELTMLLGGLSMVLVAFAFKIGAVPFHFWVPDVYQGAPTPVTAFMAAGTKAAAFGVLLRMMHGGFGDSPEVLGRWTLALSLLAAVTMIVGNLMALVQDRVKRLLAYSSVAHAGYLMLGLIAPLDVGVANTVFYLIVYAFMTIGAFTVASVFLTGGEDADHISNFAGLWQRRPFLAAAMGVFLLSLIGIPPMGGFTGKYVIFLAAIDSGHPFLATVMAIAAVIGAAYYLRVLVAMFFKQPESEPAVDLHVSGGTRLALAISVAATLLLGVLPGYLLEPLSLIYSGLMRFP
ncbi:MAG: NADH-quinone oxidoreductase subunit N [Acidobacteriota bacterium]|nr:NADH-quinone oxidoreductase subunit N [Acidobacteriota bacterium]